MADSNMAETMKRFSQRITTAKVTERQKILRDLHPCIEKPELPENAIKGILRVLLLTLSRYHDKKSRKAVEEVIKALLRQHPEKLVKQFCGVLSETAEEQKKIAPCPSNAAAALNALCWSVIVMRHGFSEETFKGEEFKKMIEIQCLLCYGAFATERNSIKNGAYRRLIRNWKEVPGLDQQYAKTLPKLEQPIYGLCLVSCLTKYWASSKQKALLDQYKDNLFDMYIRSVIGCRSRPARHLLVSCRDILRHTTHEKFKEVILPAFGKALLRNPEIILEAVCEMLAGLTIDLSQYALEIGKHLATQSHSKEEGACIIAATACKHLAKQCSDPDAIKGLVKHFFGVLNGSEGKLSVPPQRCSVMSGVGNLSYHAVSGSASVQSLSAAVAECFIPVLQQEAHEGTLIHLLAMFTQWCAKFTTEVPPKVAQWFKTGLSLKASTSAVRNGYIVCMEAAFKGDTLIQGIELLPLLVSTVEKGAAQSTQYPLVTEALSAACLLTKLSLSDIQAESKLGSFWDIVLDVKKELFINEKFLLQASDDALQHVATLAESLVMDHPQKASEEALGPYYYALVHCLCSSSYPVRHHAQLRVKRMLAGLGGSKVALMLIREFHKFLISQKLADINIELPEGTTGKEKYVSPRILAETMATVSYVPNAEVKESELIAIEIVLDAHHPCIVAHNPDCWTDLLAKLKVDAAEFIEKHAEEILKGIKNQDILSKAQVSLVSTMARLSPDIIIGRVLAQIYTSMKNPELVTITYRDVNIMNCPEGELFDKSVIESGPSQQVEDNANVRRENKAYSFAEQMAEQELIRELEKKKGKKAGEPKLSKKQQEAKAAQIQRESEIRRNLKQLDADMKKCCTLLGACAEGNAAGFRLHLPPLVKVLVSLMSSPLAAPRITSVYVQLRKSAFQDIYVDQYFTLQMAHCTLRLLTPACQLDIDWSQEPIQSQAEKLLEKFHRLTVVPDGKIKISPKAAFPAPTFAYCFPLLKALLLQHGKLVAMDQKMTMNALAVLSAHALLRDPEGKADEDIYEHGPELLPRESMLSLACQMIGTTAGTVQQMAAKVLLDTASSASGDTGCSYAEQGEIDVLLAAIQSPSATVREAALQALLLLEMVLPTPDVDQTLGRRLAKRIWIAKYDVEEENRKLATKLWAISELKLEAGLCPLIVLDTVHSVEVIRQAVAEALAAAVSEHKDQVSITLAALLELYQEKLYMPPPVLDTFGRLVSESPPDQFEARCGVAMAISKMGPYIPPTQIEPLFAFFVKKSLGDRNEEVSGTMLKAAVAIVNAHGKDNVNALLPLFEEFLVQAPDTASYDKVRQSIVILMGSLAKHLENDDPKVKPIVAKLIETLSTPSQQVQEAVANCLPPLVPAIKADAPDLVKQLLKLLLESESYGERKGAAYGLAGVVKGLGILALKQLDIMTTLTEAIQNKKNPRYREGALFAFEMLCAMLGRLFEPYVVHLLPHLLLCFGDASQYVREAADDTAKAVMSKLSAHGVKLVLPSLLSALEEDSWRTKTGSVELLGAMAYCAPKQLSACLPSIVPKLTEVLTDSHLKVQKAGAQALKQIGAVIRNPEIQALVPILLAALQDPTKRTTSCLQRLLDTKFVHFIDAPSLALIMPVVQRAFQDRSTETRKMAAQIIGNMYSLTDQKDLSPYLPALIPGLKQSLLDPVPEVRSVSARALGAMVKGMGESGFVELVPWLMTTLTSETSSVDRSGAAQGLGEVVGGLGLGKLQNLMPDIIATTERTDIAPHVRDGYIMMYIYLPTVFGDDFIPYVGPIIPSILKALADESEYVRDTALKAGQRIVSMYADTAIELLLPELEKGLFDDNWRIRYSSVQLLGDLLYKISGVSGKMTTEGANEDDNFGTQSSQQAILRVLGVDRRNRVLAGLYMGRSDTALMVRQSALHVWKVVVTHTPKMLREILPTLFQLLLGCLASRSYDKRQVAARTLGDIVRKLGEKVLPEIIPILERELESDESDKRQGVCIGLSEIMSSTGKDHVVVFADSLIPTVRRALCDPLPEVRQAAARTFDNLHTNIGSRALEDILPGLLKQLEDPGMSEFALDGLKQVMAVKSRVVLPYLIPQLTAQPVNTRALSFMASVAGEALTKHLSKILPALMTALGAKIGTPDEEQELEYCQSVVLSVVDEIGVRVVMDELLATSNMDNDSQRQAAVTILHAYCEHTKADYLEYVPHLFRGLLHLFTDTHKGVLTASWDCLNAVTKKLNKSEMLSHIQNLRQALRFAVSDFKGTELPGFCLPKKGITPILPIFREGILSGPPELKESAAVGLGEVIRRTSAAALQPSVLNITGPLIRILGDRFTFSVKVAILETLGLLLGKCGVMLKPFLPQLQTTFVKALNDPNRAVRLKAASALGQLIVIHTKVDPLFIDLHNGIKNAEDNAIRDTTLQALRGCLTGAGSKMGEVSRRDIQSTLEGLLSAPEDSTRTTAAACLGVLCAALSQDELLALLNNQLLDTDQSADWVIRHGRSVALRIALKEGAEKLCGHDGTEKMVLAHVTADRIPISLSGLKSVGYILKYQLTSDLPVSQPLIGSLNKCMKHESNEIKQTSAKVVSFLAKSVDHPMDMEVICALVPMLVMGTKEKNTVVRSNCETALLNLLRMRHGGDTLQATIQNLEAGMRDSLAEVASKALKKLLQQADLPEDLDDTVLV